MRQKKNNFTRMVLKFKRGVGMIVLLLLDIISMNKINLNEKTVYSLLDSGIFSPSVSYQLLCRRFTYIYINYAEIVKCAFVTF